jgi:hypothetical protein
MKEFEKKPEEPKKKNPLAKTGTLFISESGKQKLVIQGDGGFDYSPEGQDFLQGKNPVKKPNQNNN